MITAKVTWYTEWFFFCRIFRIWIVHLVVFSAVILSAFAFEVQMVTRLGINELLKP